MLFPEEVVQLAVFVAPLEQVCFEIGPQPRQVRKQPAAVDHAAPSASPAGSGRARAPLIRLVSMTLAGADSTPLRAITRGARANPETLPHFLINRHMFTGLDRHG